MIFEILHALLDKRRIERAFYAIEFIISPRPPNVASLDILQMLLDAGADMTVTQDGLTALDYARTRHDAQAMIALLERAHLVRLKKVPYHTEGTSRPMSL